MLAFSSHNIFNFLPFTLIQLAKFVMQMQCKPLQQRPSWVKVPARTELHSSFSIAKPYRKTYKPTLTLPGELWQIWFCCLKRSLPFHQEHLPHWVTRGSLCSQEQEPQWGEDELCWNDRLSFSLSSAHVQDVSLRTGTRDICCHSKRGAPHLPSFSSVLANSSEKSRQAIAVSCHRLFSSPALYSNRETTLIIFPAQEK